MFFLRLKTYQTSLKFFISLIEMDRFIKRCYAITWILLLVEDNFINKVIYSLKDKIVFSEVLWSTYVNDLFIAIFVIEC